jgi:uncharacterized RDD family membrane protein YckC
MNQIYYGGFWRRTLAFSIDKLILFLIYMILIVTGNLFSGMGFPFSLSMDISTTMTGTFFLSYYGMNILFNMIYFTYFHGTIGQTPGKKLFGLKVIQKTGEPMTLGVAFLRWVGYVISGLIFNLGFIWVAFDSKKRGWHDMIAATYVIRINRGPVYQNNYNPNENFLDKRNIQL